MTQIALVTGATRGIGLEIARQLGGKGLHVLLGARTVQHGEARAAELRDAGLSVEAIELDVCDDATHARAAAQIAQRFGRLDALINNAGIFFATRDGPPGSADLATVRTVYDTNFFGPMAVTQAMLPLLRAAPRARIVFVSSGVGSLARNADPDMPVEMKWIGYNGSKAAINLLTIQLAAELHDTPIKVNAVCPGFVRTDMNEGEGELSVEEGAAPAVHYALLGANGPSGGFFNQDGPLPW